MLEKHTNKHSFKGRPKRSSSSKHLQIQVQISNNPHSNKYSKNSKCTIFFIILCQCCGCWFVPDMTYCVPWDFKKCVCYNQSQIRTNTSIAAGIKQWNLWRAINWLFKRCARYLCRRQQSRSACKACKAHSMHSKCDTTLSDADRDRTVTHLTVLLL